MENLNNYNLKEQALKMYVEKATPDQLQHINLLLEQGIYNQVNAIIEDYIDNIMNNKNLKDFSGGNPSDGGRSKRPEVREEKISTEEMNSEAFELYCILLLIDEYEREQDKEKKEALHNAIQKALNRYRNTEEFTSSRSL